MLGFIPQYWLQVYLKNSSNFKEDYTTQLKLWLNLQYLKKVKLKWCFGETSSIPTDTQTNTRKCDIAYISTKEVISHLRVNKWQATWCGSVRCSYISLTVNSSTQKCIPGKYWWLAVFAPVALVNYHALTSRSLLFTSVVFSHRTLLQLRWTNLFSCSFLWWQRILKHFNMINTQGNYPVSFRHSILSLPLIM